MHSTKKLVGIAVIAFFAGALMMWFAGGKNARVIVVGEDANNGAPTTDMTDTIAASISGNVSGTLQVRNQPPGDSVLIDAVILAQNGWVVIHEDRDGQPGNILGARRLGEGSADLRIMRYCTTKIAMECLIIPKIFRSKTNRTKSS